MSLWIFEVNVLCKIMTLLVLLLMPVYARFLEVDPAREFVNPYSYTGNNPVNLLDPTGKHVTVSRTKREGQKDIITIHMTAILVDTRTPVPGKILSTSDEMAKLRDRIIQQFQQTYTGETKNLMYQGTLDLKVADNKLVANGDEHQFHLVDPGSMKDEKGYPVLGRTYLGALIIELDSDLIYNTPPALGSGEQDKGSLERTSAHEAGHAMFLDHPKDVVMDNIMNQTGFKMLGYSINEEQLLEIEKAYNADLLNKDR